MAADFQQTKQVADAGPWPAAEWDVSAALDLFKIRITH